MDADLDELASGMAFNLASGELHDGDVVRTPAGDLLYLHIAKSTL